MITTRVDTSPDHLAHLISKMNFPSTDELAQHLGVHHTTVYRWLTGVQRIPVAVIRYLELKVKTK